MTIESTTNRVIITGNDVTVAIPFPYSVHTPDTDLVVVETIIATGVQTVRAITTYWTWSGTADDAGHYPDGGTVTAVTAPASTVTWTIYRDPPATQGLDLVANDDLPAEATEAQFDYITMLIQRVKEQINRTIQQPEGDAAVIDRLPSKVDRASMFLAFDGDGDPIASAGTSADLTPVSTFINTFLDDADAATARATLSAAKSGAVTGSGITESTGTLLGRTTAATGAIEEITPGADLTFSGGALGVQAATTSLAGKIELATQAEADAGTPVRALTTDLQKLTMGTPQATTSGASITFSGLPAGIRRILVLFNEVSISGTDELLVQIGPVAGVETSGYLSTSLTFTNAPAISLGASTAGFIIHSTSAAFVHSGILTLALVDSSTNTWVASYNGKVSTASVVMAGGSKSLAGVLTKLTIKMDAAATFDAGSVNIIYER